MAITVRVDDCGAALKAFEIAEERIEVFARHGRRGRCSEFTPARRKAAVQKPAPPAPGLEGTWNATGIG